LTNTFTPFLSIISYEKHRKIIMIHAIIITNILSGAFMITNLSIADLHIHSCASDSTETPAQIISELVQKDISIASLTDHNTIVNQNEFLSLAELNGITAIPGVEISSKIGDIVYHILAYGFNLDDKRIPKYVDPLLLMIRDNGRKIIKKMLPDFSNLSLNEYDDFKHDCTLGGWKFIHYLHFKGITENAIDGLSFRKIYDCPLSHCDYPSPDEVINEVHSWGAFAVLAHPRGYFRDKDPDAESIINLFNKMKSFGIDGIECYYPKTTTLMTETAIKCAEACPTGAISLKQ